MKICIILETWKPHTTLWHETWRNNVRKDALHRHSPPYFATMSCGFQIVISCYSFQTAYFFSSSKISPSNALAHGAHKDEAWKNETMRCEGLFLASVKSPRGKKASVEIDTNASRRSISHSDFPPDSAIFCSKSHYLSSLIHRKIIENIDFFFHFSFNL